MLASCCVARKIFRSEARASSRARTLDSRPTINGVIMYGKMTTSRMGIIGSLRVSNFSLFWVTLVRLFCPVMTAFDSAAALTTFQDYHRRPRDWGEYLCVYLNLTDRSRSEKSPLCRRADYCSTQVS